MNVFQYAASEQAMANANAMSIGKELKTTFYSDLSMAEFMEDEKGVRETTERVMKEWIGNVEYIAEFILCLNWKIWEFYESNEPLARVYNDLWEECQDKVWDYYEDNKEAKQFLFEYLD